MCQFNKNEWQIAGKKNLWGGCKTAENHVMVIFLYVWFRLVLLLEDYTVQHATNLNQNDIFVVF